ncbi:MAG: hypothetical protein H0U85_03515 [Gemmatimonadales bacterium]|nr:hypothetical protein [Gemmatimonadales bacterium]
MNPAILLPWVAIVLVAIGWIYNTGKVVAVLNRLAEKSEQHDDRLNTHGERLIGHEHDLTWIKRNMGKP